MKKMKFESIGNDNRYNHIGIEKSNAFLDNLQDFILDIGMAKLGKSAFEHEGKKYDFQTYFTLFHEVKVDDEFETRKRKITDFKDGDIIRYHNKKIEMIFIFFQNKIEIIFYADKKNRKKIIKSLEKFVAF